MRISELKRLVEQLVTSGGSGGGLALGTWSSIDEWVGSPDAENDFASTTAFTVPSEIFILGYFDMTNTGSGGVTARLHEQAPSSPTDHVLDWVDGMQGVDSTISLKGNIPAGKVPVLASSGDQREAAIVIQVAKRRPLV